MVPSFKLTTSKYRTTIHALEWWKNISNKEEKRIENPGIFKATTKTKLVSLGNAIVYFRCVYKTLNSLT